MGNLDMSENEMNVNRIVNLPPNPRGKKTRNGAHVGRKYAKNNYTSENLDQTPF
jgi:hypothetical protein